MWRRGGRTCETAEAVLAMGEPDEAALKLLVLALERSRASTSVRRALCAGRVRRHLVTLSHDWSALPHAREHALAATRLLCALGLPPSRADAASHGVRILALDGGGTRGLLTIELLRALEAASGRRVHELFDVVAGTSTGGLLALGIQEGMPLEELEQMYLTLAATVFKRAAHPRRYGQLLFTGAAYQSEMFEALLRERFPRRAPPHAAGQPDRAEAGVMSMLERRTAQEVEWCAAAADAAAAGAPPPTPPADAFVVASLSSRSPPRPFVFRNYEPPDADADAGVDDAGASHGGTSGAPAWQALRASTAAPSYFKEFTLPDLGAAGTNAEIGEPAERAPAPRLAFVDGGLLANNPTALAILEAKRLYPHRHIACVASFGSGEFDPTAQAAGNPWARAVSTLVRAATRTADVHALLASLLAEVQSKPPRDSTRARSPPSVLPRPL